MSDTSSTVWLALWISTIPVLTAAGDEQSAALATEARQILSNRCFACHGPDDAAREGGFRLDQVDAYLAPADSGERPVVPGEPAESEVMRRIESDDAAERMPPPEFGESLTALQRTIIRKWIQQGGQLPMHWSFIPPKSPAVPSGNLTDERLTDIDTTAWSHSPIDQFTLPAMLARDLKPSGRATKAELIRRVSLDITGLPPSTQEVQTFLADQRPDAYIRLIERLLASPAYGEHWARKWLDLARYADSAGYADDPPRTIWAYRDWVIDALNDNMPLDEFTIQQIAGDLLPDATEENLVATAFHRNTMTNSEGGTNDEEFRNAAIVDRVNTTMAVWMGVTAACAQCHNHKYDPISQQEYFQLFAIFNQTQDADRRDESPTLELFTGQQQLDRTRWKREATLLREKLSTPTEKTRDQQRHWESNLQPPSWHRLKPKQFVSKSNSSAEFTDDGQVRVTPLNANLLNDQYTVELEFPESLVGSTITCLQLEVLPDSKRQNHVGLSSGGNFVLTDISASIRPSNNDDGPLTGRFVRISLPADDDILSLAEVQVISQGENIALHGTATQSSTAYEGEAKLAIDGNTDGNFTSGSTTHTAKGQPPWWEIDLGSAQVVDSLKIWNRTDNRLQSRLNGATISLLDSHRRIVAQKVLEKGPTSDQQIQIKRSFQPLAFRTATADYHQQGFADTEVLDDSPKTGWAIGGQTGQRHELSLALAQPLELTEPTRLRLKLDFGSGYRNHLIGTFRLRATATEAASDWVRLPPKLRELLPIPPDDRPTALREELATLYAKEFAASHQPLRQQLSKVETRLRQLKPATSVPVMRQRAPKEQRDTFIQIRGNYKSLGQQVAAGLPEVFHPMESETLDRLALAKWLVDRRNPLTARVWVNRLWESLFGLGIVRTSEEFGAQGDLPSHPQLLDWLAIELMESGWDNKQLLRLILGSQTYQQTSRTTSERLSQDRDNIWLSRGPRVRLSAEMIRDQALAVSGLLSHSLYGEPTRPPQPNLGLKAAFGSATDWVASQGEARYRRGLYTTWRRSNPYPSMATFDAPSREVCTLRRESTNTPLQALVTLNDPAFVEAAQAFARRTLNRSLQHATDHERVEFLFSVATSRPVSADETEALLQLLQRARQHLEGDEEAAMRLATDPLGPLPEGADAVELAAWTTVCNVLLNLDELLMKR